MGGAPRYAYRVTGPPNEMAELLGITTYELCKAAAYGRRVNGFDVTRVLSTRPRDCDELAAEAVAALSPASRERLAYLIERAEMGM